jgi:uncharacterized protein (DUF362 family)
MPRVSLRSISDDICSDIEQVLSLIGRQNCVGRGDAVLLKPNLHGGPGYTSPEILEALCRWCFDRGAGQVTIGDGPFWGMTDGTAYFAATGVADVARRTGAKTAFFHSGPYRVHHPGDDAAPEALGISEHLYEADVVISVPVPKTHFHTLVTLALKNLKGCLRPVDKKRLHEGDLNAGLGVACRLVAPLVTVHILDGTTGYEGVGPGNATPFPWGLIAASDDPVALDATVCRLMGIDPAQVRLIAECQRQGVGTAEEIEVAGESIEAHCRRFVLPHEALAESFPGLKILSQNACSVCMQNLFMALGAVKKQGAEPGGLTVLIGPGPTSEADVLIGRCAMKGAEGRPGVPGCPPDVDAICDIIANVKGPL